MQNHIEQDTIFMLTAEQVSLQAKIDDLEKAAWYLERELGNARNLRNTYLAKRK